MLLAHSARSPSLRVHLLAGLPTEAVLRGFEQAGEAMSVIPLDSLVDAVAGNATRIGILLPPFVEPSLVVESWEDCDFLPYRFGRPAHVEAVWSFVDIDHVGDQLASSNPLSSHGWGRGELDGRSVADIVVGQIESATHLVLVGAERIPDSLSRCLAVLNPGARHIRSGDASGLASPELVAALCSKAEARRPEAPKARSARVVPPWLTALRDECVLAPRPDLLVYRRTRPFDARRFGAWLNDPPPGLVRGKGRVWLASDSSRSYGYSCAGSVHRLFPGERWWASCPTGTWPSCASERRRLLEQWHPRFGDRRQQLVLAGVDLDADRLCAGLDACLVAEALVDDALDPSRVEGSESQSLPRPRLH